MKILVMSDSHGRRDLVMKCIRQHPDVQAVIHLGDLVSDIKDAEKSFPELAFYYVKGNCDFGSNVPAERLITLEGTGILLTHGHTQGVKYGVSGLVGTARKNGAVIALFGHTHVPYNKYHNGIYVLNPGSLSSPRDCSRPSYGLIEITPQGILTNTPEFVQHR